MSNYVSTGDVEEKLDIIIKGQKEQARKRQIALTLGAIGAIIAAARLGIVAVPMIKAAKARPRRK
jgi:hypothetical protein